MILLRIGSFVSHSINSKASFKCVMNALGLDECMQLLTHRRKNDWFLTVDKYHFLLMEPDTERLGWGVVKFVGLLQVCLHFSYSNVHVRDLLCFALSSLPLPSFSPPCLS